MCNDTTTISTLLEVILKDYNSPKLFTSIMPTPQAQPSPKNVSAYIAASLIDEHKFTLPIEALILKYIKITAIGIQQLTALSVPKHKIVTSVNESLGNPSFETILKEEDFNNSIIESILLQMMDREIMHLRNKNNELIIKYKALLSKG